MYKCIYVGKRTSLSAILTMYSVSVSRRCTLRTDYICPEEPKTRQSTIEGAALQLLQGRPPETVQQLEGESPTLLLVV
jgi:hypothetical protein